MKDRFQQWLKKMETSKYAPLIQFVKFGLVGVSNTLIAYGIEMFCYYVLFPKASFNGIRGLLSGIGITAEADQVRVVLSTAIAFFVSTINSYYWNSRYVFKTKGQKQKRFSSHLKSYLKTTLCYALTGLVLSPIIKIWLTGMAIPYWLASLGSLIVTIPLNFLLNKFWAFRNGKETA